MNIVVAYKWAENPQEASVRDDGTLDWSRATAAVSEYDPVAVEMARQLADDTGAQVVGVTAGGPDADSPKARKAALSRGLDRLVVVVDDMLVSAPSTIVAAVLAAAVRRIGDVALVITGDSSVDMGAGIVPALVAGHLGWPAFTDVTGVSVNSGLLVERATGQGTQQLHVEGSAVLSAATDANVPRVPGMRDILAAGKKPVEALTPADLDSPPNDPRIEVVATAKPRLQPRKNQHIDTADPATAAGELLAALRKDGLL